MAGVGVLTFIVAFVLGLSLGLGVDWYLATVRFSGCCARGTPLRAATVAAAASDRR